MTPAPETRRQRANRLSAQRSTGPRTDAGKVRAARNALKHGLRAGTFFLLDDDAAAFRELEDTVHAALAPQDPFEAWLCARVARALWRERRADRMEADLMRELRRSTFTGRIDDSGSALIRDGNGPRAFVTLLRYPGYATAEHWRCLKMLEAHRARGGLTGEPANPNEATTENEAAVESYGSTITALPLEEGGPAACRSDGEAVPPEPDPAETASTTAAESGPPTAVEPAARSIGGTGQPPDDRIVEGEAVGLGPQGHPAGLGRGPAGAFEQALAARPQGRPAVPAAPAGFPSPTARHFDIDAWEPPAPVVHHLGEPDLARERVGPGAGVVAGIGDP